MVGSFPFVLSRKDKMAERIALLSGWFGSDCSQRFDSGDVASSAVLNGPSLFDLHPWLRPVMKHGSHKSLEAQSGDGLLPSADPQPVPGRRGGPRGESGSRRRRRRPLIYVYDLPPEFNSRLLQYKIGNAACSHRLFEGPENRSIFNNGIHYGGPDLKEGINSPRKLLLALNCPLSC